MKLKLLILALLLLVATGFVMCGELKAQDSMEVDLEWITVNYTQDTLFISGYVVSDSPFTEANIVYSLPWTACNPVDTFIWTIPLPKVNATYWWFGLHYSPYDGGIVSDTSEIWHFFIKGSSPLGPPILISPVSGATLWFIVATKQINLEQNRPNPFGEKTTIEYTLEKAGATDVAIYNVEGQRVKTLWRGYQETGTHKFVWDGTNEQSQKVASGVYFYKLRTQDKELAKKMILVK